MKRFRKSVSPKKIRFFHCGEYGEASPENDFIARPHYHAIIFNHQFDDLELYKSNNEGINLFTSNSLDRLWPFGFSTIGELTFESAAYCARYCMKKVNGKNKDEHYTRTDHATGDVLHIEPEYATMSRRPGIGKDWYESYKSDFYPSDSLSVRGVVQRPPKYYDYLYDLDEPGNIEPIKLARVKQARKHKSDNTPERLATREIVKKAQTLTLNRKL
jgi:hypothetical protein